MNTNDSIIQINVKLNDIEGKIELMDGTNVDFDNDVLEIKIHNSVIEVYYGDDIELIPLHQIKRIWWIENEI